MENTIQNKGKFFSLYYGLFVGYNEEQVAKNSGGFMVTAMNINNKWLELRPLSKITDKHALEVAKLISPLTFYTPKRWLIKRVKNDNASYIKIYSSRSTHYFEIDYDGYLWIKEENDTCFEPGVPNMVLPDYLAAYDYLRSKRYALPFLDCSINEQINFGWIKLKEN